MLSVRAVATKVGVRSPGPRFWTLVDQGIVSLGSALTIVLLARNLKPNEFGVAVLVVAVMLFLNTVHASLIVYPLSVIGAPLPEDAFRAFVGRSLASTLVVATPLGLVQLGVARAFVPTSTAVWSAIALIVWQLQETSRRALLAHFRHRVAIRGDFLSYIGQVALIGALGAAGRLTLPLVFFAMTATSVIGMGVQVAGLRPIMSHSGLAARHTFEGIRDGRWTLPSNLLGAVIMQAPIWTIALLATHAAAGQFQAIVAIVGVMNPVMYGAANFLTPAVARATRERSNSSSRRLVASSISHGAFLLVPYVFILWLWPDQLLGLTYGRSSPYTSLAVPLRLMTLAYLLVFLVHIGNSALFGLERPRAVLTVQLVGAIVLVIVGIPFVVVWGVMGAVIATIIAHAARSLVCAHRLDQALQTFGHRRLIVAESG